MNEKKLVTIFVVTYNRADYLKECLDSILDSEYKAFDLIVLDNASTDNTFDLVKSYNDLRLKYIKHTKNIGGIANINYAFQVCDTKYFIVFHDDDIMHSNLILEELSVMEENPDISVISASANLIDPVGEPLKLMKSKQKKENKIKKYSRGEYLREFLIGKSGIVCPSVMYRTDFFKDSGLMFDNNVGPAADQYLWFETERLGGVICQLTTPLMDYRIHSGQDSNINYIKMTVKLYSFLDEHLEYRVELVKYKSTTEVRFFKFAISIWLKFCRSLINQNDFIESIELIRRYLIDSTLIGTITYILHYLVIRFPKLNSFLFNIVSKILILKELFENEK